MSRKVALTEENLLLYLTREWFAKSFKEIVKDFGVKGNQEHYELYQAMASLTASNQIIWFYHPKRHVVVYTTPGKPSAKQLLERD